MGNNTYIHIAWKCHKKTSCIAILNKQKNVIFYKIREQVLPGGIGTSERGENVEKGIGG
jgi:hypothetical protein